MLAQDTAPEPDALDRLAGSLELAPSVAFVAPKLVRWDDRSEIVSLGVSMTRFGRTVGLADGELDQGQHDGREDVLGADVRGILARADAWRELGGLDPALAGADEGLDLGVRARLSGRARVARPDAHRRRRRRRRRRSAVADHAAAAPAPRVRVARGPAAPPARLRPAARGAAALADAPSARALALARAPGAQGAGPDRPGVGRVGRRGRAARRSRRAPGGRLKAARRVPWAQLAPLRTSWTEIRESLDDEADDDAPAYLRRDLRFFSGGGAWLVLAALVVSIAAFPALLAWPVLGGGALQPLRATVVQLWADAAYGQRALGLDTDRPRRSRSRP